jgi:hypothetical protein
LSVISHGYFPPPDDVNAAASSLLSWLSVSRLAVRIAPAGVSVMRVLDVEVVAVLSNFGGT